MVKSVSMVMRNKILSRGTVEKQNKIRNNNIHITD